MATNTYNAAKRAVWSVLNERANYDDSAEMLAIHISLRLLDLGIVLDKDES